MSLQTAKIQDRQFLARSVLHPSTLLLLGSNAIPLFGVAVWHWDAFLLVMLYWMETAVIVFWTIVRIALSPGGIGLAEFFAIHAGGFMTAHFVFLWAIFSGAWSRQIHGVADFLDQIVVRPGLWVPLAAFFISRGVSFMYPVLMPRLLAWLGRAMSAGPSSEQAAASSQDVYLVRGLYGRIIVMQVVIIFGGFFSTMLGTLAPLIILVVLKTAADLGIHLSGHPGIAAAAAPRSTTASVPTIGPGYSERNGP